MVRDYHLRIIIDHMKIDHQTNHNSLKLKIYTKPRHLTVISNLIMKMENIKLKMMNCRSREPRTEFFYDLLR